MVSKSSNTHTTLIITSGTIYNVKALLGSDVAIKLEKIPQDIRYKLNTKTYKVIIARAFRLLL